MLITFEGCEGMGKSTQANILYNKMLSMGFDVILTKEPGGTDLANKLRDILLQKEIEDVLTEFLIISAARRDHIVFIHKAIENKKIVISDRFFDSSFAYQGYAKKLDLNIIENINKLVTENLKPDVTFLLDDELDLLNIRLQKRQNNFYDNKNLFFHQKVRNGFLERAKIHSERFYIIKADESIENISNEILNITLNKLC